MSDTPLDGDFGWLDRQLTRLLPAQFVGDDLRAQQRALVLLRFAVLGSLFTLILYPAFRWHLGQGFTARLMLIYPAVLAVTPLVLRRTGSIQAASHWLLGSAAAVLLCQVWFRGGAESPALPWLASLPVGGMLLCGVRTGVTWGGICLGSIVGITLSHALGWVPGWPAGFPPALAERMIAAATLTLALTYLAWMSESRIERLLNHLEGERKRFLERSIRDSLTGLANRTMIFDSLVASDARCRRHGLRGAFFFIDLDGFKAINDAHGHTGGDHVLVEVARRLRGLVRMSDMAGRLGGDEFALIVEGTPSPAQAAVLADRVYRVLSDPIELETGPVRVGASIGVAFYGEASSQREGVHAQRDAAERTIKAADLAMYHAKRSGQPFAIRGEDGGLEAAHVV